MSIVLRRLYNFGFLMMLETIYVNISVRLYYPISIELIMMFHLFDYINDPCALHKDFKSATIYTQWIAKHRISLNVKKLFHMLKRPVTKRSLPTIISIVHVAFSLSAIRLLITKRYRNRAFINNIFVHCITVPYINYRTWLNHTIICIHIKDDV